MWCSDRLRATDGDAGAGPEVTVSGLWVPDIRCCGCVGSGWMMYSMGLAMLTGTVPATQLGRYLSREIGWLTDEVPRSAQRMKQVFNGWVRFRADQMLPALSS